MTKREALRQTAQERTLMRLGFTADEAETLRRISLTLRRWFEHECNGTIQRRESDNVPCWYSAQTGICQGRAPDRERGAYTRLAAILAAVNARPRNPDMRPGELASYIQTDPRGAALYILRPGDVPEGRDVSAYYSRGICVY